jgi:hypothetical protein
MDAADHFAEEIKAAFRAVRREEDGDAAVDLDRFLRQGPHTLVGHVDQLQGTDAVAQTAGLGLLTHRGDPPADAVPCGHAMFEAVTVRLIGRLDQA